MISSFEVKQRFWFNFSEINSPKTYATKYKKVDLFTMPFKIIFL